MTALAVIFGSVLWFGGIVVIVRRWARASRLEEMAAQDRARRAALNGRELGEQ